MSFFEFSGETRGMEALAETLRSDRYAYCVVAEFVREFNGSLLTFGFESI
jgi:hypothetical protein